MKGKIFAKVKTEKMDIESKDLWTSFDDELMEDFRTRMSEGGSDPDNYNFTDPIVGGIEVEADDTPLDKNTCKNFVHNPDAKFPCENKCSDPTNLSLRCGYTDATDSKQCPLYSDSDGEPDPIIPPIDTSEVEAQEPPIEVQEEIDNE